jgi:2Fe-2S ferredoxin
MAKITYIEHTNKKHIVEVPNNMSVMEGAVQNNIPGIDADCGGSMACATCHVYIDNKWLDKLKKKEEGEEDMLDMAYQPNKFSRLSCQLIVSNELDGLILRMPSKQG